MKPILKKTFELVIGIPLFLVYLVFLVVCFTIYTFSLLVLAYFLAIFLPMTFHEYYVHGDAIDVELLLIILFVVLVGQIIGFSFLYFELNKRK